MIKKGFIIVNHLKILDGVYGFFLFVQASPVVLIERSVVGPSLLPPETHAMLPNWVGILIGERFGGQIVIKKGARGIAPHVLIHKQDVRSDVEGQPPKGGLLIIVLNFFWWILMVNPQILRFDMIIQSP